ncbi:MAG: GDP-mannose 4,6-dehydratase [bacterium]|nr:GDP-mannose 4,6-dehydratase [bacterium]
MSTFQNLRFFVTGGAGFIGSHVCEMLLEEGGLVTALDNFDSFYDRAEKLRNIEACLKQSNFRLIEGDIRSRDLLISALREARADVVIHLAAKAGVRPSLEDPAEYADVNVRGTIVVLEAARICEPRQQGRMPPPLVTILPQQVLIPLRLVRGLLRVKILL